MFESIIFSFSLLDRIRTLDEANLKLRTIASRDPLTGLFNRTAFFERFDAEIAAAQKSRKGLGVLYIDLDGFKTVNDRYGHRTGDLLLQVIARRLRMAVRDSDTIARLGGDEFAILVTSVNTPDVLEKVKEDVMRMADTPVTVEGTVVSVGITAGSALYPRDGVEPDKLIEASDRAMYAAKQARAQAVPAQGSTTSHLWESL
jgi:diguanylate cyclase (GGDEF)-like protein